MVSIQAYFKGTGFHYPVLDTAESIFEFLDDDDVRPASFLTADEIYKEMEQYQEMIHQGYVNGYLNKKVFKRIVERFNYPNTDTFVVTWFANVRFLLKTGRIQDDNKFGFLIIDIGDVTKTWSIINSIQKDNKKLAQICGVCSQPAKQLCSKCNKIYYCCREHQVADWKEHKKICCK
jgi:hypothetical protein